MKTQLSHLLSVAEACRILGEDEVFYIVHQLLCLKNQSMQFQQNRQPPPPSSSSSPIGATGGADLTRRTSMSGISSDEESVRDKAHGLVQAMTYSANNNSTPNTAATAQLGSVAAAAAATATSLPSKLLASTSNPDPNQLLGNHAQHHSSELYDNCGSPSSHLPQQAGVPPPIKRAWKQLTSRSFMLDKLALIKFAVPVCVQPHTGSNGHMGLFECLMYAMQHKLSHVAPSSTPFGPPLIAIPDLIIVLAICRDYQHVMDTIYVQNPQDDQKIQAQEAVQISENPDLPDKADVHTVDSQNIDRGDVRIQRMARWMFILYDAFQKKGVVARDTLHRFLSDVHGDDCYKRPSVRKILDNIFAQSLTITSREFVDAIQRTMTLRPRPSHILLDWMAVLASALAPPAGGIAESTVGFLKQIDQEQRLLQQICQEAGLDESRLYEVKRRFHSLVESGVTIIHGDPMSEDGGAANEEEDIEDTVNTDVVQDASMGRSRLAASSQPPKHVITKSAFCRAVCPQNDEMGHGGYLPQSIALQVFSSIAAGDQYWDITHVLRFGGAAVRSDELSLVQWIVRIFGDGRSTLDRHDLCQLVVCLCDHWDFRAKYDTPKEFRDADSSFQRRRSITDLVERARADSTVKRSTATMLGLHKDVSEHNNGDRKENENKVISVGELVDSMLRDVGSGASGMTTEELLRWHCSETDTPKDRRRLGPFMMELRIIASVLFGVPPKSASVEYAVVSELQRRHKRRFPQSEANRRGPRGTVWYLINDSWYKAWSSIIKRVSLTNEDSIDLRDLSSGKGNPRRLDRINNTVLLRQNGSLALRSDIRWRYDYDLVSPLVWSALQAWYDGGPPIYRTVVPHLNPKGKNPHSRGRRNLTENEIELYPLFVSVFMCDATSRGEARPFQQQTPLSQVTSVRVLLLQLCKGLDIDPDLGRLWVMGEPCHSSRSTSTSSLRSTEEEASGDGNRDWLLDLDKSITEQCQPRTNGPLSEKQIATLRLLLEVKDEESGKWPRGADGRRREFKDKKESKSELGDGIVGLYNMGNTCYLNSSIQCLSHTPIFRDYFNAKYYLNDINTSNPLGHKGQLAQVSAVLINSLWKRFNQQQSHAPKRVIAPGSYAPVNAPALTPKTFKESLGRFSEHFAGNEQHDAQELLAFLLGGLSEDLNRIVDKPYIEAPDSDGRPDSELADIWWSNHLKREMSIIVALFTGQYKSLLTCRSCNYESARFEPFSFLQLPLPEDDHITVSLILYPIRPGVNIMRYSVRVSNDGTLYDVLIALAKILHADETPESESAAVEDVKEDPDTKEKREQELQALYKTRADNMAVVDMRERYIFRIAPNSWALSDLQNKDTGELPPLHIYELDPIPQEKPDETKDSNEGTSEDADDETESSSSEGEEKKSSKTLPKNTSGNQLFLAVAQRRSEEVARYFLHPLAHRVFGTPLLLRIPINDGVTGSQLYDIVARRLHNFVPKAALKFLTRESSSQRIAAAPAGTIEKSAESEIAVMQDSANGEISVEEDDAYNNEAKNSDEEDDARKRLVKTTTDMEDVAAGTVPRYGFRLRITSRDGKRCALCPWYECCIGCLVPDDNKSTVVMSGDSVVVDWHLAVDLATSGFGSRRGQLEQGNASLAKTRFGVSIKNHASCGIGAKKKGYSGAITLEDCLDQFAKEEKIPEAYCSKCKDFRVQTKTMSLWRLPPIVIIQLKRFQFTQHMRRKLRDFVAFPIEGLDLSRIVSPDSTTAETTTVSNLDLNNSADSVNSTGPEAVQSDTAAPSVDRELDNNQECRNNAGTGDASPLTPETGRSEMLYDLYAVVHHQGALSGGHYVASLKSEIDGQWRLFNDAQIYEIHSRDVVDSSAYILFYIRRDVKKSSLEDFWDTRPRNDGEAISEEEMDKMVRGRYDRCVVS